MNGIEKNTDTQIHRYTNRWKRRRDLEKFVSRRSDRDLWADEQMCRWA